MQSHISLNTNANNPISLITHWFNISKEVNNKPDINLKKVINFAKFHQHMDFVFSNYQNFTDFSSRSVIDLWFIFSVIEPDNTSPFHDDLRTLTYKYSEQFKPQEIVRLFHIWERINCKPDTNPDDIDLFFTLFNHAMQNIDALDESFKIALFNLKEKFYPNTQMNNNDDGISLFSEQEKRKALNLISYWKDITIASLLDTTITINQAHINEALSILLTYFEKHPNEFHYYTTDIWNINYTCVSSTTKNNEIRLIRLTNKNIENIHFNPIIKLLTLFFSKKISWDDLQSESYENIGITLLEQAIRKSRIGTNEAFKLLVSLSSLSFSYDSLSQHPAVKQSFKKFVNTHFKHFDTKTKLNTLKLLKSIQANPVTFLDEKLYSSEINYYKNIGSNPKRFTTEASELFSELYQFKKSNSSINNFIRSNINSTDGDHSYFNNSESTLHQTKLFLNLCWSDPAFVRLAENDHLNKITVTNKVKANARSLLFTEIQIKDNSYLLLSLSGKFTQEIHDKLMLKVEEYNKTAQHIKLALIKSEFVYSDYNELLQIFKEKIQGASFFNTCSEGTSTIALMILFGYYGNDLKIKGSANIIFYPMTNNINTLNSARSLNIFIPVSKNENVNFIRLNDNKIALLQACCAFCRANKPHAMEILALAGNYGIASANKNTALTRRLLKIILPNNTSSLIPAEPIKNKPTSTASETMVLQQNTKLQNSFNLLEEEIEDVSPSDDNAATEDSVASKKRQPNKAVAKRKKTTVIATPTPIPTPTPTPGPLTSNTSPALFSRSCAIMTAVGAGAVILATLAQLNN